MRLRTVKNRILAATAFAFFISSCQKDVITVEEKAVSTEQSSQAAGQSPIDAKWKQFSPKIRANNAAVFKTDEYYKDFFSKMSEGVDPSECSATALDGIIEGYLNQFEFWDYVLYPDFAAISQLAAIIDKSKQYFGRNGEYTHLVTKQQRRLESFWSMPGMVRINGQHNEALANRDKIAEVFIIFTGASREDGYYIADQVIAMSAESKVFPETPLLSFDGFATTSGLIVLGDGLIETITATGVVDDIVVAGIISHEWGHQVQFINAKAWYGVSADDQQRTPDFTRKMELEADFFSSYFLTHKRGGAYNWKRVAEFNELFFNMGDCAFTSSGHHGTPRQRLNAARLGYKIASETLPKGHILSADQLHKIFTQNLRSLL